MLNDGEEKVRAAQGEVTVGLAPAWAVSFPEPLWGPLPGAPLGNLPGANPGIDAKGGRTAACPAPSAPSAVRPLADCTSCPHGAWGGAGRLARSRHPFSAPDEPPARLASGEGPPVSAQEHVCIGTLLWFVSTLAGTSVIMSVQAYLFFQGRWETSTWQPCRRPAVVPASAAGVSPLLWPCPHTLLFYHETPSSSSSVLCVAGFVTERPGTPKAPMKMSSVVLRRQRFSSASVSPRKDGGKDRATLHFKKS